MEDSIVGVQRDRALSTGVNVVGTQQSPWTVRKILILVPLFLVYFVVFAAYSVYAPFFPSEARDKGVSGTVVGLIFGTYPFVVFVVSPICGSLIPKYGPQFVLLSGVFLCGGSLILFGFCGNISDKNVFVVFCFLLRATSAIGGAASEVSAMSIIMEQFPNNVAAVTGASETFCGIGFSLGPALGGVLYTVGGFRLPFIVIGSLIIAALPLILILLKDKGSQSNEESTAEQSTSIFKALRIPAISVLALSFVIIGLAFAYIEPIFGPHFKKLGQTPTQIGVMFFLYSGVYALLSPAVGCVGDKTECFRGMSIFGFAIFGVAYLLLAPAPFLTFLPSNKVWLVYIALPVCGVAGGFSFVPIMPDLIRTARMNGMPNNSSTNGVLSSIFTSMYYLGATIGPTLAGICDEHFGFEWATSIAGFIIFGHVTLLSLFTLYERVFQRHYIDSSLKKKENP